MNCAFTNSHGSVQHDCSHCRFDAKKDGGNPGDLSEGEIYPRQPNQNEQGRQHKERTR